MARSQPASWWYRARDYHSARIKRRKLQTRQAQGEEYRVADVDSPAALVRPCRGTQFMGIAAVARALELATRMDDQWLCTRRT